MITTLLLDFSRVLAFPNSVDQAASLSQTYHEMSNQGRAFSDFLHLNTELIEFIQAHPEYPAHVFSASSKQMLAEVSGFLIPPFRSCISASELNLPKNNPASYREVAFSLELEPQELLFIDDSPHNVTAAQSAGMSAILFTSNQQLFSELRVLLPIRE